jgi:hypothetical protein
MMPLFVLDIYAKNQKSNLSASDKRSETGTYSYPISGCGPLWLCPRHRQKLEQGRTQPDGPSRVLLAVIAHRPDGVEDALRRAS